MDDLIARLEAATKGSRELDIAVATAAQPFEGIWRNEDGSSDIGPFTSSLDAALTLVPEDYAWHINAQLPPGKPNEYAAMVGQRSEYNPYNLKALWSGEADTPALALCIAALKARMSA